MGIAAHEAYIGAVNYEDPAMKAIWLATTLVLFACPKTQAMLRPGQIVGY
jgi:hypothetical protein